MKTEEVKLYIDTLNGNGQLAYQLADGEVMMEFNETGTFVESAWTGTTERLDNINPNRFIYIGSL